MANLNEILGENSTTRDERGRFASTQPVDGQADAPATSTDPIADAAPTPVEGDKVKPLTAVDPAAPPAAEQTDNSPTVPRKALEEERRKRQQLEADLARERSERTAQPAAPAAPPTTQQPRPNMFEDPSAWEAQQRQERMVETLETSQFIMRNAKPDYEEAEIAFADEANGNPALFAAMWQNPMSKGGPAGYAYEQGKKIIHQRKLSEIGDIDQHIAEKVRAGIEAELAKANPATQTAPAAPTHATPPNSLAAVRSAAPRHVPSSQGPTPLSSFLPMDNLRK